MLDVLIIGAGPVGLACSIEAKRHGLTACVVEKGALVNSIIGYPINMEFFSTPELIEIGGYPFPIQGYKPTREQAIEYYRGVAQREEIDVCLYERVRTVSGDRPEFTILTDRGEHRARNVVVVTGFFDQPNRLDVAGEGLPKVSHYYREPYPYIRQKLAVIGAKNSAVKAALECHRHGAEVTLIARAPGLSDSVKYWIKPDLENRIREGSIRAFFSALVLEITPSSIVIRTVDGTQEIENDWVLAMTGYQPDFMFLESLGITFADDGFRTPVFDETTFETTRLGMYIAGTVCGGYKTNRWFIENGRFHAQQIAKHIAGEHTERIRFDKMHWKTEE